MKKTAAVKTAPARAAKREPVKKAAKAPEQGGTPSGQEIVSDGAGSPALIPHYCRAKMLVR